MFIHLTYRYPIKFQMTFFGFRIFSIVNVLQLSHKNVIDLLMIGSFIFVFSFYCSKIWTNLAYESKLFIYFPMQRGSNTLMKFNMPSR